MPNSSRLAQRIARRLTAECGVVLAEIPEALCIVVDREAVARNIAMGMDYWQWSLRVDVPHRHYPTVLSVGGVTLPEYRQSITEIGGSTAASAIGRAKYLAIERCPRTGNIELHGGSKP